MRKIALFIITIIMVAVIAILTNLRAVNDEWYIENNYTYQIINQTEAIIVQYNGIPEEEIIVPSSLNDYTVIGILENAFDCSNVQTIVLSNDLKYITVGSFYNCDNVTSLTIPADLNASNCFVDLNNVEELIITFGNDGFMLDYDSIENTPWFNSNLSIDKLVISDGVRYLGNYAFSNLVNLTEVSLPKTIESLGKYCFFNTNKIELINLPYGLKSINEHCFDSDNTVVVQQEMIIPQSVIYFGTKALGNNYIFGCYDTETMNEYLNTNEINYVKIDLVWTNKIDSLKLGDSFQINISENEIDQVYTFYSSQQRVAAVTSSGYILTNSTGITKLSIVTDTAYFEYDLKVEYDSTNETKYSLLNVGESFLINPDDFVSILPDDYNVLKYTSDDERVLSVDQQGTVKAKNGGYAKIHITDSYGVTVDYLFHVQQLVTSIKPAITTLSLHKGNSYTLACSVLPSNADNKSLSYHSTNTSVAVVNSNGKITALKDGTCEIIVSSTDGSLVKSSITVSISNVTISVETNEIGIMKGKSFKLRVTSSAKDLLYASSNNSIATVDSSGKITGVTTGDCVITIYNTAKTSFASVNVRVYKGFSYGLDISRWNGNYLTSKNFTDAKNDGIDFVYIRAGYGIDTKDINFEKNYSNAVKAGLDVGAYHYIMAQNKETAIVEANSMLKWIEGKKFEYPIMVDFEDKTQKYLDKATFNAIVNAYCEVLESQGYKCIIYSYASMLNKSSGKYDSWVAQWNTIAPDQFRQDYTIWQITSKGKVNGFANRVDMNICFYDYPSYIKKNHYNGY